MDDDEQLEVRFFAGAFLEDFIELALNFDTHREGALDFPAAFAVRAIVIDGGMDAFGVRWRVISSKPNCEIGRTCVLALSRRRPSFIR